MQLTGACCRANDWTSVRYIGVCHVESVQVRMAAPRVENHDCPQRRHDQAGRQILIQSDAKLHHVRYRCEPGAGLPQVRADRALGKYV
jgi:hypothetical protein